MFGKKAIRKILIFPAEKTDVRIGKLPALNTVKNG
jgi:hypothetical protein